MYKIFDLHNDYFTSKKFEKSKQSYLSKASKQSVLPTTVVWTSKTDGEKSLLNIQRAAKLVANQNQGMLAIEDLHFVSKSTIYEIINHQPAYCGLTWNNDNNLAGGAHGLSDLTHFGRLIVKQLENADIIVDTAHLNERSFMTFSNITTKPMICSHTACYDLIANPRNLKDYQIKIIVESGGLVGLCLVSEFLSGSKFSTILDYVNHIDHCVCKFGIDYFCIGSDFCGTKYLPQGITDYKSLQKLLAYNLEGIGYKPQDINKLLFENANQFFQKYSNNYAK